jgi:hypothetical protein
MRKILSAVVVAGFMAALGGTVEAKDMTNMKGLGWYDQEAPIGGIIWFSPKMGLTGGIGFNSFDDGNDATDEETQINFTVALPIVLAGGDDVNFMFRPGVLFKTNEPGVDSYFAVRGDLAVELFLTSRASVLAGHGIEFVSSTPDFPEDADSQTAIRSRAISATEVGFYYYFAN